jgi:hypothetical protein
MQTQESTRVLSQSNTRARGRGKAVSGCIPSLSFRGEAEESPPEPMVPVLAGHARRRSLLPMVVGVSMEGMVVGMTI